MYGSLSLYRHVGTTCFSLALAGFCLGTSALAGEIDSAAGATIYAGSPGLGTVSVPVILTVNLNNDNQTGGGPLDNNIFVPIKRFDHNGSIDIQFPVLPTQGVTEYKVFESVDNNTGTSWNKYTMELGSGVGAAFVPAPSGSGLDFDFPTFDTPPSSSAFASVALGENKLTFSNGLQSSGAETYQFRIDVPDLASAVGAGGVFTLRQTPLPVPEPSTILLVSIAIGGFLACGRRQ
jgi:hypothetical protein